MIINHNMASLNTYRQLSANNTATSKSLEKLSSGLRINRAGDDAAGLAISEKMRGQIRGLDQATRNAQDATSLLNTAEGNLNETHSILQRMKELATQASNDTNVGVDRGEIQKEINQLTSEINRIGNTTEFNTQKLLKGGDNTENVSTTNLITAGKLASGTDASVTQTKVTDTVATFTTANAGKTATYTVGGKTITVNLSGSVDKADSSVNAAGDTITIGVQDANYADATESATKLKTLLNDAFTKLGIGGEYQATNSAGNLTISAIAGSAADGGAGTIAGTTGDTEVVATPGTVTQGNTVAGAKATTADIDLSTISDATAAAALAGKGFTVDGQVIEFYDGGKGAYTGNGIGVDIHGAQGGADVVANLVSQTSGKLTNVTLKQGSATTDLVIEAKQAGTPGNNIAFSDGGRKTTFTATFQVGANMGQSMSIEINDMRSKALLISGTTAGAAASVTGAVFAATQNVTDGTNNTNVEYALDVSDHNKATAAIKVLDNAINTVSAERSKIGAYTNRLEHTINNLGTSSENLTAAESRIRDVDMAKEMMNYQKNNILSQAATAMLAQANQQPQGVLQLLR